MGVTAMGAAITGAAPEGEAVARDCFCMEGEGRTPDGFPPLRPPCCGTPIYGVTSMIGWFCCDPGTVGREGAWTIS
jgi:hypothetical protein